MGNTDPRCEPDQLCNDGIAATNAQERNCNFKNSFTFVESSVWNLLFVSECALCLSKIIASKKYNMKSKYFLLLIVFLFSIEMQGQDTTIKIDKTIFITGGSFGRQYIQYLASLTNKPNPRICFVPTASADNVQGIANWYANCEDLPLKPYVLRTFINSSPNQKSFEEIIMSMDAIIVGGGNTLNMIAIWKAQGIDTVLRKAYNKGIIMSGGSAGSLCWFTGGSTDSRPKQLTLVDCLGFLNYSHSPHYHAEPARRPLYHNSILSG